MKYNKYVYLILYFLSILFLVTNVIACVEKLSNDVSAVSTYTVTFNANGGTVVLPQTVTEYALVAQPQPPTRTGYAFGGWYTDDETFNSQFDFDTPITENISLYAQWTIIPVIVTFNTNGGSTVAPQTVAQGTPATEPQSPIKEGFNFTGWYTDDTTFNSRFDFTTPITEDITLYAKWTTTFTVTFVSNGGTGVPPQKVVDGTMATQPQAPTRTGYTFEGWYTDAALTSLFNFATLITEDLTLYAKWTQ